MGLPNQSRRSTGRFRLLRLFLGLSALTWGAAGAGVFVGWETAAGAMQGLGAESITYDPMLDYWLRMVSGVFGLIGCWYLILTIWPQRFSAAIPWFGVLMLVEGLVLLVHGLRLGLPPFPFYGDVSACVVGGGGILLFAKAAVPELEF